MHSDTPGDGAGAPVKHSKSLDKARMLPDDQVLESRNRASYAGFDERGPRSEGPVSFCESGVHLSQAPGRSSVGSLGQGYSSQARLPGSRSVLFKMCRGVTGAKPVLTMHQRAHAQERGNELFPSDHETILSSRGTVPNGLVVRSLWLGGLGLSEVSPRGVFRTLLLGIALLATLTISSGRRGETAFEVAAFLLAASAYWIEPRVSLSRSLSLPLVLLGGIGLWGFVQAASGMTADRDATLDAALRFSTFGAVALCSAKGLRNPRPLIAVLAWSGAVLSAVGMVCYFTSPGRILWFIPSRYPDVWGVFESRNAFAQFLELCLPAALCLNRWDRKLQTVALAAFILAGGLLSASRAGAVLLLLETVCFAAVRWRLVAVVALILAITGPGALWGRLHQSDPLEGRREIYRSTLAMIEAKPWTGYGLGTFALIYPRFATFDEGRSVEHAHNDWLEWVSGGGIPFALPWLVLVLWMVRPALESGWGVGVLAVFLHALVDYPFARFGISAWGFLILGALVGSRGFLSEKER